ncbi:MAG: hypothetical protein L0Y58_06460 [Verrucomicrobia subdivision 3 bacterium]|nr:hypothetical protein [Limisphaerales bacterium]
MKSSAILNAALGIVSQHKQPVSSKAVKTGANCRQEKPATHAEKQTDPERTDFRPKMAANNKPPKTKL